MLIALLKTSVQKSIREAVKSKLPNVRVRVNQGVIKGVIEPLPDGRSFQRFSAIPYAEPPINELKFRDPLRLLKFKEDEIDCTKEGNICYQKSPIWRFHYGTEDCLHLNVYVPNGAEGSSKLPVMIFIHGGAFLFDSGRRDL